MPAFVMVLGKIIAQMGLLLLSERVVRKITVVTLKALAEKTTNKLTHDIVATVSEALEVPPAVK